MLLRLEFWICTVSYRCVLKKGDRRLATNVREYYASLGTIPHYSKFVFCGGGGGGGRTPNPKPGKETMVLNRHRAVTFAGGAFESLAIQDGNDAPFGADQARV